MKILKSILFSFIFFLIIGVSLADTSCVKTGGTNLCMSITQNDLYEYIVSANCAGCTMSCKYLKVGNLSFNNFKCRSDFYYDKFDIVNASVSFLISGGIYNFNQNFDFNLVKFIGEPTIIREGYEGNGGNEGNNGNEGNSGNGGNEGSGGNEGNGGDEGNNGNEGDGGDEGNSGNGGNQRNITEGVDTQRNCIWKNIGNNSICIGIELIQDRWSNIGYHFIKKELLCGDSTCEAQFNKAQIDNMLISIQDLNGREGLRDSIKKLKIYVKINGVEGIIEGRYDFRYLAWCENSDGADEEAIDRYTKISALNISTSSTSPRVGEVVAIKIETNKDYIGEIHFLAYKAYKLNNHNSRTDIPDYNNHFGSGILGSPYPYRMQSGDNGQKVLSNFVIFKKNGDYKIIAENIYGTKSSIVFNVGNSSSQPAITGNIAQENTGITNDGIFSGTITTGTDINPVNSQEIYDYNPKEILSNGYSRELNDAYTFAFKNGITTMKTIDQANMNGSLSRIAMAKMLSQYAINVLKKSPDTTKQCSFSDVTMQMDSNYDNGVTLACQLGIMGVGMTKFRPNDDVTRAEFGTALSRMLYGLADGTDKYYSTHLAKLKKEGIISNDNPTLKELRGYVMLMLMRSAK